MAEAKQKLSHAKTRRREEEKGNGLSCPLSGWVTSALGDILALNYGWSLSASKRVSGSVPVYGSNGIVDYHNEALVNSAGIIVGRKGSAGNVHFSKIPFCPIDTTFYVSPSDTNVDLEFLFYLLKFVDLKRIVGDVGVPGLNREMAYLERVIYPADKREQRSIATILGQVQKAIEEQEKLLSLTAELKRTLLHQLFTQGLRNEPQKQTDIGPIPKSWEVVQLGEVINLFAGYAFKSTDGVSESNTQLLRMGNLYQNTLELDRSPIFYPDVFADAHKRFVLKEGDLVMSLTGTSGKEDYGFTVRIPKTDKTLLLNQRVARIDITDNRLQKDFAHYFLLSRKFLDHLFLSAKGMKQANLSTNAMKKLKVVLPCEAEQQEIATCFKSVDQKVVVVGRKVAALQDLFRTLLHELMTAKTRVVAIALQHTN